MNKRKTLCAFLMPEKDRFMFRLECTKRKISMGQVLRQAAKEFVENKKN